MKRSIYTLLLLSSFLVINPGSAEDAKERIIAGWLEKVVLSPWQIKLKAKLDTGAKTSSIHAENIQRFERDGKPWVHFDLPKGLEKNAIQHTIEVPLLREVQIKQHQLPSAIRSVVELGFCINGNFYTTQFTLADRGNFNYPVLLGRRFLKHHVLIDSAAIFMHSDVNGQGSCLKSETEQSVDQVTVIPSNLHD
jgi:hypothetical protein